MKFALSLAVMFMMMSCNSSKTPAPIFHSATQMMVTAEDFPDGSPSNIKFYLKDKPSDEVSSVIVNVDRIEFRSSTSGQRSLANGLGEVDLMQLRNGVMLDIGSVFEPGESKISQMRFYLNPQGHYLTRHDGSICYLQVPSQVETGLKIINIGSINIEANKNYVFVIDFDVDHSIVLQGNGGCLLKPVIKMEKVFVQDKANQDQIHDVTDDISDEYANEETNDEPNDEPNDETNDETNEETDENENTDEANDNQNDQTTEDQSSGGTNTDSGGSVIVDDQPFHLEFDEYFDPEALDYDDMMTWPGGCETKIDVQAYMQYYYGV